MFGNRKAVLEMPADASASAGGGALEYAGFWARVVALLVDTAIMMIFGIVLIVALSMALGAEGAMIGNIVWVLVYLLYWPVMESSARQATFGKSLLGIQVTDLDGNRTSFVRSLLRNIAKIISAIPLYIGFLLAAFTGRKQALHDMITSCLVVRAGPSSFLKALVAAVVGLAIAIGGGYYYFTEFVMSQMKEDMGQQMGQAMKEMQKGAPAMKPPVAKAPSPVPPPKPADAPAPAPKLEPQVAAVAPSTPPAPKEAAPAMKMEMAPKPALEMAAAPSGDKPKPARRVAPRKPAAPAAVAEAPPAPPAKTPKYNDVMTAVVYRDQAAVRELLELGFWVDRPDSTGATPLMAAALIGDAAIVQLLLKSGANANSSAAGGSVLDNARKSGDAKIVEMLRRAGAR